MEPTVAVSLMSAATQGKIAGAVAARMMKINQDAAQALIGSLQQSTENLESLASRVASGLGTQVDFSA